MALPQIIKDEITKLYIDGKSIKAISSLLKVSEPTISKILKASNIPIRKNNYSELKIDKVLANDLYIKGHSTYDIAKHFGCSDETIRKIITAVRPLKERNKLKQESIDKIRQKSLSLWQDPAYRSKVYDATNTEQYRSGLKKSSKQCYKQNLGKWIKTEEARRIISDRSKSLWQDEEYLNKQRPYFASRSMRITRASVDALKDGTKRSAWIDKIRRTNANRHCDGWVSSSQKQLYYILNTSDIIFHEEGHNTKVGPFYVVDCIIPTQQNMTRPLIIEVQGEYWHSLPHIILKDRQKASFINNNTNYDLLYIDELQMSSFDEVQKKLEQYGLQIAAIECECQDTTFKQIDESQARDFYSVFHYTSTIRKGALTYGLFLKDRLIAAISYNYPLRTETATRLGCKLNEVLELSRMARRTNVQCKNLLSYFIARTRRSLPKEIKRIVSFSDSTYGHAGGVYKASGFILDGVVEPDYHYVSMNGKYHKKTIWDRAKKMRMAEKEYAEKHNLQRVVGKAKTRWVYLVKDI